MRRRAQTATHLFDALDRAAAAAADRGIALYQRWLSPLKGRGRVCAHRAAHGGDSCSQHARRLLAERGFCGAVPAIAFRFEACRVAATRLAAEEPPPVLEHARRRRRGQCCVVIPLPTCRTTHRVP